MKLQDWVRATSARVVIIFEGRDAAGKGGIIRHRTVADMSPRVLAIVQRSPLGKMLQNHGMHFNLEIAVTRYAEMQMLSITGIG